MNYLYWLLGVSAFFVVAERLRPARRAQPMLRRQLGNDLCYLLFNGHFFAVLAGGLIAAVTVRTSHVLSGASLLPARGWLDTQPFLVQALVYLLASDFLQWCVHNLLHRVPWLWQFHKVHHSIHTMDWIGNFRFHWMEVVVYRSLLFIPLLWLGGAPEPLFAVAVFSTFWGHFNHANVNVGIGPLGYVFNSPRMHLWHHDSSSEGGVAKNFGIVFSLWDFLFGTAYWPRARVPARIGYPGDDEMPVDLPRQMVFPLLRAHERRDPPSREDSRQTRLR